MLTALLDTPIGTLNIGASARGLRLVQFPRDRERDQPFATGEQGAKPDRIAQAQLDEAVLQLTEYFDGDRTEFDIALDWYGVNGLRLTVLKLLAEVPFGETVTYGDLAKGSGAGVTASQAVGGIMGSNPLPIVVPCHRVLAADGLGGFGGGLRTKEWLLAWEGVMPPALDWGV
ncbi:methylated-DNA-[protein]-cysteine S-methyltransferase [Catenulispora sp. GP43]|uniref:methylated-DNA--[protein]-cysteine S-methyltransferase n=1 Tax=Catenulispora sp. GP43 TaxID=3156263 RepID=UPI0035174069